MNSYQKFRMRDLIITFVCILIENKLKKQNLFGVEVMLAHSGTPFHLVTNSWLY